VENDNVASQKSTVNLEDLMLLEEKLVEIITDLSNNDDTTNQCYEWWNLFFNCSLCGRFQDYFKDEKHKLAIRKYENLELITLILCYDLTSKCEDNVKSLLKTTLDPTYRNYLILCHYFISKMPNEYLTNVWVMRLDKLLAQKLQNNFTKGQHINEIKASSESITDYIKVIMKSITVVEKREALITFVKNIHTINSTILNDFFQRKIFKIVNRKATKSPRSFKSQVINKKTFHTLIPKRSREGLYLSPRS
jgi:hypothetical protein